MAAALACALSCAVKDPAFLNAICIIGGDVGDRLFLERIIWFEDKEPGERSPSLIVLREYSETAPTPVQRSIDHYREHPLSPSNSMRCIP